MLEGIGQQQNTFPENKFFNTRGLTVIALDLGNDEQALQHVQVVLDVLQHHISKVK